MLETAPSQSAMTELLGQSLFDVWQKLCAAIDEKYEMERLWNTGGKNWTFEYKYRRGGKTLCCLYAKSRCIGFMIIFGKEERAKFEDIRETLSSLFAGGMMKRKSIMTESGSCLNRTARPNLTII